MSDEKKMKLADLTDEMLQKEIAFAVLAAAPDEWIKALDTEARRRGWNHCFTWKKMKAAGLKSYFKPISEKEGITGGTGTKRR